MNQKVPHVATKVCQITVVILLIAIPFTTLFVPMYYIAKWLETEGGPLPPQR